MEAPPLRHLFIVGAGGVVGALSRYGVDLLFEISLATLIINLFGVAIAAVCLYRLSLTQEQQLFLVTGLAGGFTTYSAFALLLYDLTLPQAGLYITASLLLSLAIIRVVRAGVR